MKKVPHTHYTHTTFSVSSRVCQVFQHQVEKYQINPTFSLLLTQRSCTFHPRLYIATCIQTFHVFPENGSGFVHHTHTSALSSVGWVRFRSRVVRGVLHSRPVRAGKKMFDFISLVLRSLSLMIITHKSQQCPCCS